MRVVIKKWGNGASVRIPAAIMEATNLRLGEVVNVREEGGLIVIEPVRSGYDIAQLVAGITPDNLHAEEDFEEVRAKTVALIGV